MQATAKPSACPENRGAENYFVEENGPVGRAVLSRKVHWNKPGGPMCCGFSLVEL